MGKDQEVMSYHPFIQREGTTGVNAEDFDVHSYVSEKISSSSLVPSKLDGVFVDSDGDLWMQSK